MKLAQKVSKYLSIPLALLFSGWRYIEPHLPNTSDPGFLEDQTSTGLLFAFLGTIKDVVPWILMGALLVANILIVYEHKAGKRRAKRFLDTLHRRYFKNSRGEVDYSKYRCTMFVATRGKRWLRALARSGHERQESKSRWSIIESEDGHHDGVCGYAWVRAAVIDIDNLPDPTQSVRARKEYCRRTFISEEKYSRLSDWKARSFRAVLVQRADGRKLGVLMLESLEQDGLSVIGFDQMYIEAEYYLGYMTDK